ncbi:MAG: hypothetical protein JZU63_02130, partial [Rhodoferax sp.]|nr:hypothetical protein [Rhodoferax sp.]
GELKQGYKADFQGCFYCTKTSMSRLKATLHSWGVGGVLKVLRAWGCGALGSPRLRNVSVRNSLRLLNFTNGSGGGRKTKIEATILRREDDGRCQRPELVTIYPKLLNGYVDSEGETETFPTSSSPQKSD